MEARHRKAPASATPVAVRAHAHIILRLTLVHRFLCIGLLLLAALLQRPFDSSPLLQLALDGSRKDGVAALVRTLASHMLRWDTLHFVGVASPRPLPQSDIQPEASYVLESNAAASGLALEQSLAWQPGILWLLRIGGYLTPAAASAGHGQVWEPTNAVLAVSALATVTSCLLPVLLYHLTCRLSRNEPLARLAASLSILSPSPATLVTPTPESFSSFFALLGQVILAGAMAKDVGSMTLSLNRITAALCFATATVFRANGILLSGFLIWHVLAIGTKPGRSNLLERILKAAQTVGFVALCSAPLLLYQVWAYSRVCGTSDATRPWCQETIPSAYAFVQSHYWDVGPFRYWTVTQLPNWLLAAPVLAMAGYWLVSYVISAPRLVLRRTAVALLGNEHQSMLAPSSTSTASLCDARDTPEMLPHLYFTIATLTLLVVASHVQIALRFASPGGLPAVWWGAASILVDKENRVLRTAKSCLIPFLVLWNISSIILYAGFYPPA